MVSHAVFGGNMTPPVKDSRIRLEPKKRLLLTLQVFALLVSAGLPVMAASQSDPGVVSSECVVNDVYVPELKALEPKFDDRVEINVRTPGRLYPILNSQRVTTSIFQPAPILKRFDNLRGLSKIMQVELLTSFDSKTAYAGLPVQGRLTEDFRLGEYKIASAGAILRGEITGATPARTLANSAHDAGRRFRPRGCVSLQFDEIVDVDGKHIPITGTLTQQVDVMPGKKYWEIRVDRQGRIIKAEHSLTPERQRAYNMARLATMVPIPIPGNFLLVNCVAVPLVIGVGGAADPSFAYNKPIDKEVSHRRLKGFTYAFVTNLPGAFYVQAFTEKGNEVTLRQGDQLSVNLAIGSKKMDESELTKVALQDNSAEGIGPTPLIVPSNGGTRLVPAGVAPSHLKPVETQTLATRKVEAIVLKGCPLPGQ
jgi:hypothetical protein